jgi:hypothetical protein
MGDFIAKMRETCVAEIRQEIQMRGKELDSEQCISIARGKIGPLFAICAALCTHDTGPAPLEVRHSINQAISEHQSVIRFKHY